LYRQLPFAIHEAAVIDVGVPFLHYSALAIYKIHL